MSSLRNRRRSLTAGICIGLFLLLIILLKTVDVRPIGPMSSSVGLAALNGAFKDGIGYHEGLEKVSDLLGKLALLIAAGFACLGLYQLVTRKSLKKVDADLFALAGLYAALVLVYVFFEKCVVNYRPLILDEAKGMEPSFPSSHTMLSVVIFLSAAYEVRRRLKDVTIQKPVCIALAALCAVTVLCRLFSGVHWLTDILGGLLISAALLSLHRLAVSRFARKKHAKKAAVKKAPAKRAEVRR